MSAEGEYSPDQTVMSLVNGIFRDLQDRVEQHFPLTWRELEAAIRRRLSAAAVFALGIGVIFLGANVSPLSASHLMRWMGSRSGSDLASFPLGACHAVVASVFVVSRGILVHEGRVRFPLTRSFQTSVNEKS